MKLIDPSPARLTHPSPTSLHDSRTVGLIRYHVRGHYRHRARSLIVPFLAAAGLGSIFTGCEAGPGRSPEAAAAATSPVSLTVRADWDDVDAALEVALSRAQLAILSRSPDGPDRVTWRLLSVQDEPAHLTAVRPPGATQDPTDITLEARIGLFGDPRREEQFLKFMERRLNQLAGVDYAPLTQ